METGARLNPGNGDEGEGSTDDIATQTCRVKRELRQSLFRASSLAPPVVGGGFLERSASRVMRLTFRVHTADGCHGAPTGGHHLLRIWRDVSQSRAAVSLFPATARASKHAPMAAQPRPSQGRLNNPLPSRSVDRWQMTS